MKRSEINRCIQDMLDFCGRLGFHLPPWATRVTKDWTAAGHEAQEVRANQLGWDVTDFGKGDFARLGLTLFTVRNGLPGQTGPMAKDYCEKVMLVREEQHTPYHFHFSKMEDIINRGGGRLVIKLNNSTPDEALDTRGEVSVQVDGFTRILPAGGELALNPGESVTLPPRLYHEFWGQHGAGWVLVGEVSRVNDDARDNRFLKKLPRFPSIEEDEPARFCLCNEYPGGAPARTPQGR